MNVPVFNECTPNPNCACGCGKEVSRPWERYFHGHARVRNKPAESVSPNAQAVIRIEEVNFLRALRHAVYANLDLKREYLGLPKIKRPNLDDITLGVGGKYRGLK